MEPFPCGGNSLSKLSKSSRVKIEPIHLYRVGFCPMFYSYSFWPALEISNDFAGEGMRYETFRRDVSTEKAQHIRARKSCHGMVHLRGIEQRQIKQILA